LPESLRDEKREKVACHQHRGGDIVRERQTDERLTTTESERPYQCFRSIATWRDNRLIMQRPVNFIPRKPASY